MSKIMLDIDSFKALASESRLDILRALDGKKLNLKDLSSVTKLNKATLHAHLSKLHEAGFIKKKEREGHKWVYYKLTWKGESLLHPENTRVVVMFNLTFLALFCGIIQLVNYARGTIVGFASTRFNSDTTQIYAVEETGIDIFQKSMNLHQVGELHVESQSIDQLSNVLNQNADIKGLAGNTFSDSDLQWNVAEPIRDFAFDSPDITSDASTIVATVQDSALLYIATACFVIFIVILCFSIWRLWKIEPPCYKK